VCAANIDEASDLEACKLLATNAKNLSLEISETLRQTHSACIRIDKATRKELGLTKTEIVSGIVNQVSVTYYKSSISVTLCVWWGGELYEVYNIMLNNSVHFI
jgi:hypothetical protein